MPPKWGWYINELSALFLGMASSWALWRVGFNGFGRLFTAAWPDFAPGAGGGALPAASSLIKLEGGNILHTILYGTARPADLLPSL